MRPLRLVIENFTCFKDRQAPLDFSDLELFAIAGPTGAGKSSLLDAILFALYGRVPRMRRGYTELISLGRDRMSVVLDFALGERRFRITRASRRGRSADAQLDELTGGREKPVAGGVQAVETVIGRLIGLRYEAFTQAVVLPQGEFARFLKSQPRDRREILRDLLRHQVYEQMRRQAAEQARDLRSRLHHIGESLARDFSEATEEHRERLARKKADREKENRRLSREHAEAERSLELLRVDHGRARELHEKRERFTELLASESEMAQKEARLDFARRAAPVAPLLSAVRLAEERTAAERARARTAQEELSRTQDRLEKARGRKKAAEKAARAIPELREALRLLDEVSGLLEPRASAQRRLGVARQELADLERRSAEQRREKEDLGKRLEALSRELTARQKRAAALDYDPVAERKLDAARESASELAGHRQTLLRLRKDLDRAEAEASALGRRSREARRKAEETEAAAASARRRREEADGALRALEDKNRAASLRLTLVKGERCPVCDQPVRKLPPPVQASLFDDHQKELEVALRVEDEVRHRWETESQTASNLGARTAAKEREVEELRHRQAEEDELVKTRAQRLESDVGALAAREKGKHLEERVLSAARKTQTLGARYRALREETISLETEEARRRSELESLCKEETAVAERKKALEERIRQNENELAAYEARLQEAAVSSDPSVQRDQVAARLEELEEWVRESDAEVRAMEAALITATTLYEEADRVFRETSTTLEEARARALQAVRGAGFSDEAEARAALMGSEEVRRLERELATFRREREGLAHRIAELEQELGGKVVSDEELEREERAARRRREAFETGIREAAELGERLKGLDREIARAKRLAEERIEVEDGYRVSHRLADDLRSEHFQAYLLTEAFRDLVRGASVRLERLSGRYSLEYREESFHVLDRDNAGERRSADTLSGGETFLTSLALALELSVQVQRAAGAVDLESLFIDEGFGTLDSETLDTVAEAIESLPVGGRMVGIITHIPELTERLPACVRVEKRAEGSSARLERT